MIERIAPAKINLTLHVTGRRPDGYHQLDSLVVFTDFGDRVRVKPARELGLTVSGPFCKGIPLDDKNLAIKAAQLMGDQAVQIDLDKQIPHGAGIGGGSSDAAATLSALAQLSNLDLPGMAETLQLGADVPVCLHAPVPAIMRGIGDEVTVAPPLPQFWLVLVNPDIHLATRDVFKKLRQVDNPAMEEMPSVADLGEFVTWLQAQRNDLAQAACCIAPKISDVLQTLADTPACLAHNMSGSGSTCWGLFETKRQATQAAAIVQKQNPNWWVKATRALT